MSVGSNVVAVSKNNGAHRGVTGVHVFLIFELTTASTSVVFGVPLVVIQRECHASLSSADDSTLGADRLLRGLVEAHVSLHMVASLVVGLLVPPIEALL